MKKTTLILSAITLFISSVAFAAHIPEKLQQAFKKYFPGSTVIAWELKDNVSVAVFTENETKYQAFFNADATLLGLARHITINQMPARLAFALKEKYGDIKNVAVIEMSIADRETFYMTSVYHKQKIKTIKIFMDGSIEVIKSE